MRATYPANLTLLHFVTHVIFSSQYKSPSSSSDPGSPLIVSIFPSVNCELCERGTERTHKCLKPCQYSTWSPTRDSKQFQDNDTYLLPHREPSGHAQSEAHMYSRVSFCDGSVYDDSLLRHLLSRTEHSRLVVHHCRNSSDLSLLSALLDLFRCASVSSLCILVQFFLSLKLHSFLMSSEPRPGPSSAK